MRGNPGGRDKRSQILRPCPASMYALPTRRYLERDALIFNRWPGVMTLPRSLFKLLILATVVSNRRAIEDSVSPRFTR